MEPHLKISSCPQFILLPGDPGRSDVIHEHLEEVQEISFNREYRISQGKFKGLQIGVVSTGIGCPSSAIAVEELANCGAQYVIRIGSCGGLMDEMRTGSVIIPTDTIGQDSYTIESKGSIQNFRSSQIILRNLFMSAKKLGIEYFTGTNRTHDVFYETKENFLKNEGKGLISSEMECSAIFAVGKKRKIDAGSILVVNTVESFAKVRNEEASIYHLDSSEAFRNSMHNAIQIALNTCKVISNER